VREFAAVAFDYLGLDWEKYVVVDKSFYRPAEVNILLGDYTKAKNQLGWNPNIRFHHLVKMMVDADINILNNSVNRRQK
jgi:GDPmannose 4,6-dehydratase